MPFCSKCGAEIPPDAVFCPKCGAQIGVAPVPSIRYREEKREKEEKSEKGEKHEPGEKTGPLVGGLILIWLGITFYMVQARYIVWADWWAYFLIGLGVILLIQGAIKHVTSAYRSAATRGLIAGIVILIIGLAGASGMRNWWWIIFIVIGVAIIVSGITAIKRTPKP
ncbi:MAG: zinc-ribbon domain-containing protein [Nitrososphaeria archaeon]